MATLHFIHSKELRKSVWELTLPETILNVRLRNIKRVVFSQVEVTEVGHVSQINMGRNLESLINLPTIENQPELVVFLLDEQSCNIASRPTSP